jgi:hypothetical protein
MSNVFPWSKCNGMLQLTACIKNHMKLKNLLDLMWKASINSNWTKGALLGPREFPKVTTSFTKLLWERSSFGSEAFNPILELFIK